MATIFSGRNGGLFASPTYLVSGGATPLSIVFADVIGGPSQDILVGHADGSLTFFEGDAQGGFILRSGLSQQLGLGAVVSLKASDLRQDGGVDIIAAGANGVKILGRNGSGVVTALENGDFSAGLTGWTVDVEFTPKGSSAGRVNANSGFAQFTENNSFLTTLSQTSQIPEHPQTIEFDLVALGLDAAQGASVPDAFEVSLLDASSRSLVDTHSPYSTAFVNFVSGEAVSRAPRVTVNGTRVSLGISQLSPGTNATLVFDLIGHPPETRSSVTIDNVVVSPSFSRDESFVVTSLAGPFGAIRDMDIADVNGDGLADVIVTDGNA